MEQVASGYIRQTFRDDVKNLFWGVFGDKRRQYESVGIFIPTGFHHAGKNLKMLESIEEHLAKNPAEVRYLWQQAKEVFTQRVDEKRASFDLAKFKADEIERGAEILSEPVLSNEGYVCATYRSQDGTTKVLGTDIGLSGYIATLKRIDERLFALNPPPQVITNYARALVGFFRHKAKDSTATDAEIGREVEIEFFGEPKPNGSIAKRIADYKGIRSTDLFKAAHFQEAEAYLRWQGDTAAADMAQMAN